MKELSAVYKVLKNCILFDHFQEKELEELFQFLQVREARYAKGAVLFRIGDQIPSLGLLISGRIQVATDDIHGNKMIMANVSPGETFAESLALTGTDQSPVYAVAALESLVFWIEIEAIRNAYNAQSHPLIKRLGENFTRSLAIRALHMNNRIQILSKKTIREKVIVFLTVYAGTDRSKAFSVPFSRTDMADYLGVERSALSRELSKMASENIIRFNKNQFYIVNDT